MNLAPYQFDGKNELWDGVHNELSYFIEGETVTALDAETLGEARIHAAGRASALVDFRAHLLWLREEAVARK